MVGDMVNGVMVQLGLYIHRVYIDTFVNVLIALMYQYIYYL
jgi:hypothetical protein